jgi:XTP/dITP diphosphohydrolase
MARQLSPGSRLVLASHNPGKLTEIIALLAPHRMDVVSAAALGLPEPEETEPDFAGNARLKAVAAATASGLPSLADDSGFCVAGLDGAPGVVSARWAGPSKDFGAAMRRVHDELGAATDRRAWFISVLALAWPDGHVELFEGRVDGGVVWPPRGGHGFGYDPMFVPEGSTLTSGEKDAAEKKTTSHRARAFAKLLSACFV